MGSRFDLETPEAVTVAYDIAGIGNRFLAAVIDSFAMLAILLLIVFGALGLSLLGDLGRTLAIVLAAILIFVLAWGYFVLFETLWSGQTPGKRAMGIRVIKTTGYPIGLLDAIIRNIVRIVDFLPTAYGVGVTTMFISMQSRRLGDYAAGTIVVKEKQKTTVADLIQRPPHVVSGEVQRLGEQDPDELEWNLRLLTAQELVVIREFLARSPSLQPEFRERVGNEIAVKIADRIGARHSLDPNAFLARVLALYESE